MPARAKKSPTPSAAVDAQLARYREMRDFSTTAEPSGPTQETSKVRGLKQTVCLL